MKSNSLCKNCIRFSRYTVSSKQRLCCCQPLYIQNRTMNSHSPSQMNGSPLIKLTESEANIQNLLVEFSALYKSQHPEIESLVLRITGGWVRDKLLGLESNDLDIAVDSMTGLQFAEALNGYISDNSERLGIEPRHIHKIEKNPEKSKHLETATTRLYGLDIDFVNLRSEEYAHDSRVPIIRFGTPQEDAFRRDATLNALFYNLTEQKVEDFTGSGLADLEKGVLRTPLPPFETFNDDPLRVLRLLRFASTFGFEVSDGSLKAMEDDRIKEAFLRKISRERVGVEVSKMLVGKYPYVGLELISKVGFDGPIFCLLDTFKPSRPFLEPKSTLPRAVSKLREIVENLDRIPKVLVDGVFGNKRQTMMIWLCAALSHWGVTPAVDEKKRNTTAVMMIVREGLKLSIADAKLVSHALSMQKKISEFPEEPTRVELGQLMREVGEHWPLVFTYALLKDSIDNMSQFDKLISKYSELLKKVIAMELHDCWDIKPLVNGKDILKAFNARGGPWMAKAVEKGIEFQLEHPNVSAEECMEFLLARKPELMGV